MTPCVQIDQFRNYDRVFYAIEFFKTFGTVPAYRDDEIGPARMLCLKPSLQRHAGPCGAGFETHRVAQNSFNAGDVGRRIPPAGDGVTVRVDADRGGAGEA